MFCLAREEFEVGSCDERIGSKIITQIDVPLILEGRGDADHGEVPQVSVAPDLLQRLEAVFPGHIEIQENQVRAVRTARGRLDTLLAGAKMVHQLLTVPHEPDLFDEPAAAGAVPVQEAIILIVVGHYDNDPTLACHHRSPLEA